MSAMMRSVYASFAPSAKISVLSVWPVAHPCSSRAERTGRHSRPSLSPPSFNARTKQPRQCSCSCYPSSPYLTSPHTALPPLLSSSHHPGVPLSDRCQMTTNTKRQSRHQRCMSATSIPTNFARFTAVGLCYPPLVCDHFVCDHFVCDQGPTRSKALVPACLFTMRSKHSPFLFSEPANHRTPSMASAGKFPL